MHVLTRTRPTINFHSEQLSIFSLPHNTIHRRDFPCQPSIMDQQELVDMYNEARYSDLKISSSDGKSKHGVHKVIVHARCPAFAKKHIKEFEDGEVVIKAPAKVVDKVSEYPPLRHRQYVS
jgi:hypothetical protein